MRLAGGRRDITRRRAFLRHSDPMLMTSYERTGDQASLAFSDGI
jgi:hypothetical protein